MTYLCRDCCLLFLAIISCTLGAISFCKFDLGKCIYKEYTCIIIAKFQINDCFENFTHKPL